MFGSQQAIGDWVLFPEIGQMMAQAYRTPPGVRVAGLCARCIGVGDRVELVFHLDPQSSIVDPYQVYYASYAINFDSDNIMTQSGRPMDSNVWKFHRTLMIALIAHFADPSPDAHDVLSFSLANPALAKPLIYHVRIGGFPKAIDKLFNCC